MTTTPPITDEQLKSFVLAVQDPAQYASQVLAARKIQILHPLGERRLHELLRSALPSDSSVQPEKWGVANGRVDLVLYNKTRTFMHFEIIASASNNHVYRDTTSLLASAADTQLAILIDEDLDDKIAALFFAAIPKTEIPFIWLRDLFLKEREPATIAAIRELHDLAVIRSGSLRSDGFRCELPQPELAPFTRCVLTFVNARPHDRLTAEILSSYGPIAIAGAEPDGTSGSMEFVTPYRRELVPGRYRLQVRSEDGLLWATWIRLLPLDRVPEFWIEPSSAVPGDRVQVRLRNLPPGADTAVFLWQGPSGQGVLQFVADAGGDCAGAFAVPFIVNGALVRPGVHRVSAAAFNVGYEARTLLDVPQYATPAALEHTCHSGTANGVLSLTIRHVTVARNRIDCDFEICNTAPSPITVRHLGLYATGDGIRTVLHPADVMPLAIPLEPGARHARRCAFYPISEPFQSAGPATFSVTLDVHADYFGHAVILQNTVSLGPDFAGAFR